MKEEIWKKTHISDDYEVSSLGRIKSKSRVIYRESGAVLKTVRETILKPFICKQTGYLQVKIGKKVNIHRVIAMAFCEGYFDGAVVNHKNGIRTDCRPENLEWCTTSQNAKHAYEELNRVPTSLGKKSKDHPTSKPVICCTKDGKSLTFWHCGLDAVREIGADSSSISRRSRDGGVHLGMLWYTPERYYEQAFNQYREAA